ncbi:MAG: carboxypeptidase M32 [Spirochaetales bacterium]|nr:carboxypeptidase M32 [Spirochaetales bacterium]
MHSHNPNLNALIETQKEIKLLGSIASVLGWDQETYMPEEALLWRSEQLAWLSGQMHRRETAPEIKDLLDKLEDYSPADDREKALLKVARREFRRAEVFPEDYVIEKARHHSLAQNGWIQAREKEDFEAFRPFLEKNMEFARRDAEYLGYEEHPYDALLDLYEPDMKASQIKELFDPLGEYLAGLVKRIGEKPPVRDDFLSRSCPVDKQEELGKEVLKAIGYDFGKGRLDATAHPFTSELGPADIRVTTRYDEFDFCSNLFSVIHEGGHALYEMGIDSTLSETLLGTGTSLGIHESQSRFWENLLGRSRAFCEGFLPLYQNYFPQAFGDIDGESFYRGINRVKPSFIRVEADEVTYSLHVILRFNLELALLEGSLAVKDLPEAWNEESRKLLGILPESVSQGVLQDVHWSHGLIGYFSTYALGNLYGAQFMARMKKDIPQLDDLLRQRNCEPPLKWLREKIHRHGSVYSSAELCRKICGEDLDYRYFIDYLEKKYLEIYGV